MSTTFDLTLNMAPNKTQVIRNTAVYTLIASIGLVLFYGSMVVAEHLGFPAWAGFIIPTLSESYLIWKKRMSIEMFTGLIITLTVLSFAYYIPNSEAASIIIIIGYIAVLAAVDVARNIQVNSWRYLDYSL